MVEFIRNFTTSDLDEDGRPLVGSNQVLSIYLYDATAEGWRRDYATVPANPFVNADFTATTVTGSAPGVGTIGWFETGSDSTLLSTNPATRYFKVRNLPIDHANEAIANYGTLLSSTPTTAGDVQQTIGDFFIDADVFSVPPKNVFPQNYNTAGFDINANPWATTSGTPAGQSGQMVFSLDQIRNLGGFSFDSFHGGGQTDANALTALIATYTLEVAVSGTGVENNLYTVVSSGTIANWPVPRWVYLPNIPAKFLRFRFRNNGNATRTNLVKIFAYEQSVVDAGMALVVTKVASSDTVTAAGKSIAINQDVDLTGIDQVFFDLDDYTTAGGGGFGSFASVRIGTTTVFSNVLPEITSDVDNYIQGTGHVVDVSSFNGVQRFNFLRTMRNDNANHSDFIKISKIRLTSPWYDEGPSTYRGNTAAFPSKTLVVSDTEGLSIIDADNLTLWMRFRLGYRRMLERRPNKVIARDGRVYFSSTRGFYAIDFPNNRCIRIDERGIFYRFDISKRNEHAFDRALTHKHLINPNPKRATYAYVRQSDAPVLPSLSVLDFDVGFDNTYGKFFALGTPLGLVIIKGELGTTSLVYQSSNTEPVQNVRIVNNKVWYTQGDDTSSRVHVINNINTITATSFAPNQTINQELSFADDLGDPAPSRWITVAHDPDMVLISDGEKTVISGTHNNGGSTGLIFRPTLPDRSFDARLKVKIREFPPDARGGFRFGVAFNHHGDGVLSGYSDDRIPTRRGIYLSAQNTDPYGTPTAQNSQLTYDTFEFNRGWMYHHKDSGNDTKARVMAKPTTEGLTIKAYRLQTGSGDDALCRFHTTAPFPRRNFTFRGQVKLVNDFNPESTTTANSASAFIGLSELSTVIPGGPAGSGDRISAAMVVAGNTTYSGVLVYNVASYDSLSAIANTSLTQPGIPLGGTESTGSSASPFREWRIDYHQNENRIDAYIDDQFVKSRTWTSSSLPGVYGLVAGFNIRTGGSIADPDRELWFKDFRITYPTLHSGSSYRYNLEKTDSLGGGLTERGFICPVMAVTTYSGISLASDTSPTTSTLGAAAHLADTLMHSGLSTGMTLNQSVGVGFAAPKLIDSLHFYDTASGTNGWNTTTAKRIVLRQSNNGTSWTDPTIYDVNYLDRIAGVTKLNFVPAIEAKYLKVTGIDSAYAVPGGAPWAISELQPVVASGIGFFPDDATNDADFHDWRLTFDATTRRLNGYIDGVLISSAIASQSLAGSHVVISHDLTPVSSGTHSNFWAEVKDFSIEYGDSPILPRGDITGFNVTHTIVSGTQDNYTLMVATSEGVAVVDKDLSMVPTLPDSVVRIDSVEGLFGNSTDARVMLSDLNVTRNAGLIFIGTNTITPSRFRQVDNRPFWHDGQGHDGAQVPTINYGNRATFVYASQLDKYVIIFDQNAMYACLFDFDTGEVTQIQRRDWKDVFNVADNGELHRDYASLVYSPLNKRIWYFGGETFVGHFDPRTGSVTATTTTNLENIADDNGGYVAVYSLHNHRVFRIYREFNVVDVATNKQIGSFMVGEGNDNIITSAAYRRFNRQGVTPWNIGGGNGLQGGAIGATYSDFDKSFYIIAMDESSWAATTYVYKYVVDNDSLELIGTRNEDSLVWPYTDESLYGQGSAPIMAMREKSARAVYDPFARLIYFIVTRSTEPVLMAYDVVNNSWKEHGEFPPYLALRQWVSNEPSERESDTNFVAYDGARDEIIFANGRGDSWGKYFYTYRPERDTASVIFDYFPSRDGLPTSSGVAKHYTVGGNVLSAIDSSYSLINRDFQRNTTHSDASVAFTRTVSSGTITLSGTNPSSKIITTDDVVEYYSSTIALDPIGDFEVRAKVAFPAFSRNAFSSVGSNFPKAEFILGASDGWSFRWNSLGELADDPDSYTFLSFRAGVSGTISSSANFPFKAFSRYVDGFNAAPFNNVRTRWDNEDTYLVGSVDLVQAPTALGEVHLKYDYSANTAQCFWNGTNVGSYNIRRKFSGQGVRLHFGFETRTSVDTGKLWMADIKEMELKRNAYDRIQSGRLVTSISGAVGGYYHEKWIRVLASGVPWVYEIDAHFPTHVKYPGFDYIATLGGIGDGTKLAELVAHIGPNQQKRIGIIGDLDRRNDRNTYLAEAEYLWDDVSTGEYKMVHDSDTGDVSVYVDGAVMPSLVVPYASLPDYPSQHVYYGKVRYGSWERIIETMTLSGTWTTNDPDHTNGADPEFYKVAFNRTANFAPTSQGTSGRAVFELGNNIGQVDIYAFYYGMGFDSAINAPYTIEADSVVSLPVDVGPAFVISAVDSGSDEFGAPSSTKTTVRVNQTKKFDHTSIPITVTRPMSSGWVYLGTYLNPIRVIQTADADISTASTNPQVCADAIGVDIGKYGKSTFDMSIGRVRFNVGATQFPGQAFEPAGLTVIDLTDRQVVDFYGEHTAPSLLDSNITSGTILE